MTIGFSLPVATAQRDVVLFAQSKLHRSLESVRSSEQRLNRPRAAAQNPLVLSLARQHGMDADCGATKRLLDPRPIAKTTKLMERI
jgi:hypothetical protein